MKKNLLEFLRRGLLASGFGPIILAVVYLILQHQGAVEILTVNQVCIGIFSLSVLAFIAGGMNMIYQIEQIPLMMAIFIHGSVLYLSYLGTYLLNGWLEWGITPIFVFSGIFLLSYLVIWVIIYFITKKSAARLNEALKQRRERI